MSIRGKNIIRHYTIVEVMVAMGIFLVMMTIMMQFFTSAQKVWNLASKKNMLYADARVAMNLMTRELQSILYDNDSDGTGIYPFWYQCTSIDDYYAGGVARPTVLKEYFKDNNDLPVSSGRPYLTSLNFISTTDIKAVDEGSDVCEIRYRFIPVYFTDNSTKSFKDVRGGKLQRSCVSEYSTKASGSGTDLTNTIDTDTGDPYNFSAIPCRGDLTQLAVPPATYNIAKYKNRVANIWDSSGSAGDTDVNTSIDDIKFQTVITGVYSLRFTCYFWDSSSGSLAALVAMNSSGKDIDDNVISPLTYDLAVGTPKPIAVRIDMKLMDPEDLKRLAIAIKENDTKQIRILKQTMRTFSKVIYLGKDE